MLNYKYATEFKAAAHTETKALMGKHTWDEVRLVKKVYRLPTMWVFTYKEDSDSFVTRFKARLVVRGDL
jgi:dihydrofolate reductase